MGSEWQEFLLGEITEWSSGGTPSKSKNEYWGGNIPWISAKSMGGNRYKQSELKITSLGLKNGSRLAPIGSILLLVRGSILHKKIRVGIAVKDVAFNQDVKALTVKDGIIEPWYLLFWFMSKKQELLGLVENTGIGAGKLDTKILQNLVVKIPPKIERKRILNFVKAIDDKIELNRQINQTLEAMAQALFKSWFVDFDPVIDNALAAGNAIPDVFAERAQQRQQQQAKNSVASQSDRNTHFPAEFEYSEAMGWIPKGWRVEKTDSVTENIFSGGTPNTKKSEYWGGQFNWFSSGETRESVIIGTEKFITEKGVAESSTKLAKYGDILIASAGQGHTRGQTSFCTINTYINQSVVCLRPLKSIYRTWLFYNLFSRYSEMRAISDSHSIRGSLTTKLVRSLNVLVPDEKLLGIFESFVNIQLIKIKKLKVTNNNVSKLRDTLLPKLLSGELRIPDAEKQLKDIPVTML